MTPRTRAFSEEKPLSRPPLPPLPPRPAPALTPVRAHPLPDRRTGVPRPILLAAIAALVAACVIIFVLWRQVHDLQARLGAAPPADQQAQENAALVAEVGRLIELPTDETPTIATVQDPTQLQDQPFFAHAKAGDKVLLYANAKKAILYDPVEHKIVEVAPIDTTGTTGTDATNTSP